MLYSRQCMCISILSHLIQVSRTELIFFKVVLEYHVISMPIVLISITLSDYHIVGYQTLLKGRVMESEARKVVKQALITKNMATINAPLVRTCTCILVAV